MVIFPRNHLPTTNKNHLMPHAVGFYGRGNVEPESIGSALEPFSAWADRKWNDNEWTNGTNEFFTEDENPFCLGIFCLVLLRDQHGSTFPFTNQRCSAAKRRIPKTATSCPWQSCTWLPTPPKLGTAWWDGGKNGKDPRWLAAVP